MNPHDDEFFGRIIADLGKVAATLLDPGIAPKLQVPRGNDLPGTLAGLLDDVDALSGLVPLLLAELEQGSTYSEVVLERSPVPRRATASRSARDYVPYENDLVPRAWYTAVPVLELNSRPLAWVLWLLDVLVERVEIQQERLSRIYSEALLDREVDSRYAQAEAQELRYTEGSLRQAAAALRRSREFVMRQASQRLHPSPRRPSPFPRSNSWSSLRVVADFITNPGAALPRTVQFALRPPIHIADKGFLYQRWVGLKVIEVLGTHGWSIYGDVVAALFLGGEIQARRGETRIALWIEPRLLANGNHPSGLRAAGREASPDLLFVVPGPNGRDAFVLDPTLRFAPDALREKSRYLQTIEFVSTARIAGVPIRHTPLRSWAVAPTQRPTCDLFAPSGSTGTVPAWPPQFDETPLRAWLADLEAHALAWTLR